MSFSFDIETLLQPIPGHAPCGVSLLHNPAIEAIKAARREDDPSLPAGVWQTELKVADWSSVEVRCVELLIEKSKDLMVAVWLAEAWLHQYGWEGLPRGIGLIEALCMRFWESVHPLPRDGDLEFRTAPIVWLAEQFPVLLAGKVGLFSGEGGEVIALAQWDSVSRRAIALAQRKDVSPARRDEAKKEADVMSALAQRADPKVTMLRIQAIETAQSQLQLFSNWLLQRLGEDSPSFSTLSETLDRARKLLKEFIQMHPKQSDSGSSDNVSRDVSGETPRSPVSPPGPEANVDLTVLSRPQSRDAAYRQLAIIGDYLMRYEPHSPVPYMIQRALEWGAMPLPELLRQLTEQGKGPMLGTALGLLPVDQ